MSKAYLSLKDKTKEELLKELTNLNSKLMVEKAKLTSGVTSDNPSIIKKYKKNIARIKMLLWQKYNLKI